MFIWHWSEIERERLKKIVCSALEGERGRVYNIKKGRLAVDVNVGWRHSTREGEREQGETEGEKEKKIPNQREKRESVL